MRIQIHGKKIRVGTQLRDHLERRLQFALGRFESRIRWVGVDLEDINGLRGGADKSCRIAVYLNRGRTLRMGLTGKELIPLVDSTADRIGRAIRHTLQHWRARRRPHRSQNGNTKDMDGTGAENRCQDILSGNVEIASGGY